MLPSAARLRDSADFALVVRRGRRAGAGALVVHHLGPQADGSTSARVGFVVGGKVGGSVVRHRVTRRLRHLMRERLGLLLPGARVVVRALPPAAGAESAVLGRDLDAALRRVLAAPAGGAPR